MGKVIWFIFLRQILWLNEFQPNSPDKNAIEMLWPKPILTRVEAQELLIQTN